MTALEAELATHRIVPVVVASGPDEGLATADALAAGGLPIAEITFRVPGAAEAIDTISRQRPDILVGAGTVVTADQVDLAVDAGAQFLVSPGTSERVILRARERGLPILPGVASASDIMRALDLGVSTLKLFPAAAVGGLAMLKALSAPFPQVQFVPTGGIREDDALAWLEHPAVIAVGGSWMVERALIAGRDWNAITDRATRATRLLAAG